MTASNAIYSFSREKRDIPILRIGPGGVVGIENALDISNGDAVYEYSV